MLAEDLAPWPASGWLVIDDYQFIERSQESRSFVGDLIDMTSMNVLIATRQRPSWVSARKILYGEVFELAQSSLAMTIDEARQVLTEWSLEQASGLIALADGWPAVIGIAALGPVPTDLSDDVPETLFAFFADEVMSALSRDTQESLGKLALAPSLDREIAQALTGSEVERVISESRRVSILDEQHGVLHLHPLARSYMESSRRSTAVVDTESLMRLISIYNRRGDWDSLFELTRANEIDARICMFSERALDALLAEARFSTIEAWVEHAALMGVNDPIFRIAMAEIELRQGRHVNARALAESVIAQGDGAGALMHRALMLAAGAAHVAGDESASLVLYRRSRASASSQIEERAARWGELMCLAELESEEASAALADLSSGVGPDNPTELVREAGRRLGLELRFGTVKSLDVALEKEQLLRLVPDPIVRCSYRSVLSTALCLAADYAPGLRVANAMLEDAEAYRLDFVRPYAKFAVSIACTGLRDFARAEGLLNEGIAEGIRMHNAHATVYGYALHMRLLLHEGRAGEASQLEEPPQHIQARGLKGEVLGGRALAMACAGRTIEAQRLVESASGMTSALEARVLLAAAEAVISLHLGATSAAQSVGELARIAATSGGDDLLVAAYRASPELLAALLAAPETSFMARKLLKRSSDGDLLQHVGSDSSDDPINQLTRREREIHDLMCQGLSNKQIAALFVISEATVKSHAHNIYAKLGTRSRTVLALRAARRG